jgi:hypothetical protein
VGDDSHVFAQKFPGEKGSVRVITVKPALVISDRLGQEGCIIRGDLMKLLADVDMLLFLIKCQNPG